MTAVMTNPTAVSHIEIDGRVPTAEQLQNAALDSYGHFTAMQVRDRKVRGLALHLARLDAATSEMFGADLAGELVCDRIRHVLAAAGADDASVRVHVRRPDSERPVSVMVTVRPPGGLPGHWTLQSAPYQRSLAHIKHLADFGQSYYGEKARHHGFDDALLTGADGLISEGSITNVGFFDGHSVLWPAAPMLAGITMQLIQADMQAQSQPAKSAPVRLADVSSFASVFVTSARGVAAVTKIDRMSIQVDAGFTRWLRESYEAAPWDAI